MEKTIDLEKPIFATPLFEPSRNEEKASQPSKIYNSLEEAFAAFDKNDSEAEKPYLMPAHALPPIPTSETVKAQLLQNALLLVDSGEYSLSRNIFNEILKRDPLCAEAIRWMGWCFKQEKDLKRAQECYESLISLRETDQDHFELGEIYYAQNLNQSAIELWSKALSLSGSESPHLFDLHKGLGNAFTRIEDYESAEENYNKALTLRSHSDALQVNLGTLAFQRQNFLQAMAHFKQALEINNYNDRAWTGVAMVAREMNDLEWARSTLSRALDINPENEVARELLSRWDDKNDY